MISLQKHGLIWLLLIVPFFFVIGTVLHSGMSDLTYISLRLCGLLGFLSLSIGAIITLSKKEIKRIFGLTFIKIHHIFVISGLILITLHPVILALAGGGINVFIPDISSLSTFFTNGGRIAIILMYIGFLAWIFRSILKGRWIHIHRLMYLALLFGIIHANLLGEDFINPVIRILYNGIAGSVVLTGMIKIQQWYKNKPHSPYI